MKVAVIGECMVELFKDEKTGQFYQTFGGDTFNCAVYLKRVIPKAKVEYITVLGKDDFSQKMIEFFKKEDIEFNYLDFLENKNAGLYIINTENGERSFTYYRDTSAAKELFNTKMTSKISKDLLNFNLIYFSAITLAIMNKEGRKVFFEILKKARKKGVKIAFDSNYRSRLYKNKQKAKRQYLKALKHSDIFLPSIDDERELWGEKISVNDIINKASSLRCKEVVIKCGADNIFYRKKTLIKKRKTNIIKKVVDTTAAGDSFNGTYLGNRLNKLNKKESIKKAKDVASKVIMTKGAIIPKEKM